MLYVNKFTSHYVSINSSLGKTQYNLYFLFTSHYVSINSPLGKDGIGIEWLFTSHYVSINSNISPSHQKYSSVFTSHYVSINSLMLALGIYHKNNLHPTMYLLIHKHRILLLLFLLNLHPTMYLLILNLNIIRPDRNIIFTSHYVSINSWVFKVLYHKIKNLHPTMYLLIRQIQSLLVRFSLYLHPTMYLLIRLDNDG